MLGIFNFSTYLDNYREKNCPIITKLYILSLKVLFSTQNRRFIKNSRFIKVRNAISAEMHKSNYRNAINGSAEMQKVPRWKKSYRIERKPIKLEKQNYSETPLSYPPPPTFIPFFDTSKRVEFFRRTFLTKKIGFQ